MFRIRWIEHTADLAMEVEADSLEELFRGAVGMFSQICDLSSVGRDRRKEIALGRGDLEELMFRWLNELLFLAESELLLFSEFEVKRVSAAGLEAIALGEKYDPEKHQIKEEIKAATYHMMTVGEENGLWRAAVVFDV